MRRPRPRLPALAAALLLAVLLPGCSGKACGEGEDRHPHEGGCVRDVDPRAEVCNAWLSGGATGDAARVSCQAVSTDGHAWLDLALTVGGTVHLAVRDGAGRTVHEANVGSSQESVDLQGAKGSWTLSADFSQAGGSGRAILWG
jgi:hypothetical protein